MLNRLGHERIWAQTKTSATQSRSCSWVPLCKHGHNEKAGWGAERLQRKKSSCMEVKLRFPLDQGPLSYVRGKWPWMWKEFMVKTCPCPVPALIPQKTTSCLAHKPLLLRTGLQQRQKPLRDHRSCAPPPPSLCGCREELRGRPRGGFLVQAPTSPWFPLWNLKIRDTSWFSNRHPPEFPSCFLGNCHSRLPIIHKDFHRTQR